MKMMIICRGLPGSGKTIRALEEIHKIRSDKLNKDIKYAYCSADDYFECGDVYLWKKELLAMAHQRSMSLAMEAAAREIPLIIVDNTHTMKREYLPYCDVARGANYDIAICDLFDGGLSDQELANRNTHNVPIEAIKRMRERYEHLYHGDYPNYRIYKA